jgi:hypothetical protein
MTKEDILSLFKAIDKFDTHSFASYLDDEANFKFGNMPVVKGKNAIFEFVAGFFQAIKAIKHTNLEIWEIEGIRFVNGTVSYTRLDGSILTVNFANTFKLTGNKIGEYLIFIDNSALFKSNS